MRQPLSQKLSLTAIITASLLSPLPLSAAISDPSNPAPPVIDTEPPSIGAIASPLPTDASQPIVTPDLGTIAASIIVTDKIEAADPTPTSFTFSPTGSIGPLPPAQHTITWTATDQGLNSSISVPQTITVRPSVNLEVDQVVSEGSIAIVTAHLSGSAATTTFPVSIPYDTIGGTATGGGTDYDIIDINNNSKFDFTGLDDTSDSISFIIKDDGTGDPNETITVNLVAAIPSAPYFDGHNTSQTITIKDKGVVDHIPLARLYASQGGKTTRIITSDAGKVSICAMPDCGHAYDAGGGIPLYDWSASDNALIPITGTTGKTFEFEAQELNPGFYTIRLTVSDTAGNTSSHDLLLRLFEEEPTLSSTADSDNDNNNVADDVSEGIQDDDNDGIPNYLDALENNPSLMQAYEPYLFDSNLKQEDSYTIDNIELSWKLSSSASNLIIYPLLIATSPGLHINIGPTAFAAGKAYARLETSAAESLRGTEIGGNHVSSDGQVIDIEITHLNSAGDTALVVLPQAAPIPSSQAGTSPDFIVFKSTKTWSTFSSDTNNEIKTKKDKLGNSYCPGLDDTASYIDSLATGDDCLLIKVEDGGPNDYDGVANGTIRFMGSVFITSASVVDNNQAEGGIFTGDTDAVLEGQNKLDLGTGSGGGSLGFISLFGLLLTSLQRRLSRANQ